MKVLEEIRNDAAGAAILAEWVGAGGEPVSYGLANSRAMVCEQCPMNRPAKWWETAKDSIAETIKKMLEVKNQMSLSVHNENKVGMCVACGCSIPLKVWVKMQHILPHTSQEVMDKLPRHCWIKTEGSP